MSGSKKKKTGSIASQAVGIAINTHYEILTPDGFKGFDGIAKTIKTEAIKFTTENGKQIVVSPNHKFKRGKQTLLANRVKVNKTKLMTICGSSLVICMEVLTNTFEMYDFLDVKNDTHSFYANDIVNSNCSFLGSSKTLIPPTSLEEMTFEEPEYILQEGLLQIWEKPVEGIQYILGIDTAKGVGGDYSVIQVIKCDQGQYTQVAMWRDNNTSIDDFAQVSVGISDYYNKCEMCVENNDYGFLLASKIWYQYECDRIACFEKGILGVRANKRNKNIANLALRTMITDGKLVTNDRVTQWEFSVYEEKVNGTFSALSGECDDCVTSLLWAVYWIKANLEDGEGTDTQINPRFHVSDQAKSRFEQVVAESGDGEFVLGKTPIQVNADSLDMTFLDEPIIENPYQHQLREIRAQAQAMKDGVAKDGFEFLDDRFTHLPQTQSYMSGMLDQHRTAPINNMERAMSSGKQLSGGKSNLDFNRQIAIHNALESQGSDSGWL